MPRQMTRIHVHETSGVDSPAHMVPGFLVMKSKEKGGADRLLRKMMGDTTMAGLFGKDGKVDEAAVTEIIQKAATAATEAATTAVDEKYGPLLEAAKSIVEAEQARIAAEGSGDGEGDEPAGDDAPADVAKALPAAIQKRLDDQAKELEEVRKANQALQDDAFKRDAIAKARAEFPNVGLTDEQAVEIARLEKSAPDTYKTTVAMMKSLNGQAESAAIFKALGDDTPAPATAKDRLEKAAKDRMESTGESFAVAKAAVLDSDNELADALREGK